MRLLAIPLLAATLLCACQTASYRATSQLAGTNWEARDAGPRGSSFGELLFSSKLTPAGMGVVQLSSQRQAFYQVLDGKLVLRYGGENHAFDFALDGDTLTLDALSATGKALGSQHFDRHP
ncbi:MAG TPA: hypothetical protein VMH02_04935 [Verrucomicrobiae bacterium]|nr:hypothetical protein [Verrucomicrobiae bacterium]